jgi:hypothetical protein
MGPKLFHGAESIVSCAAISEEELDERLRLELRGDGGRL